MQKEFCRFIAVTTDKDKEVVERLETETENMKELAQFEHEKLENLISNVSYLGGEDNSGIYIIAQQEIEEPFRTSILVNHPSTSAVVHPQPSFQSSHQAEPDSSSSEYNSSEDEDSIAFAFSGRQPAAQLTHMPILAFTHTLI